MLGLYYMPALCYMYNAVMKFQYMNGLSHTHTNDLLNALLECIKFYLYIHIVFLLTYLNCFIHLTYIQLFINCMFVFLQKLDLKEYT